MNASTSDWKTQRIREALNPAGVAVLGISEAENNLGRQVLDGLLTEGFSGPIYPVHPRIKKLLGVRVFPDLESIGKRVDLVICCLNAKLTADLVAESCAKIGTKGIVCLASGFKEIGEEGLKYEKKLREIADQNRIIVFGPNILGIINNECRLYATFWSFRKGNPAGPISIVSQSGGTACSILNEFIDRNLGVSKWICLGNRANLEFEEMLRYFSEDKDTKVIAVQLEGVEDGRGFIKAAQVLSEKKPVVVLKGARSESVNLTAKSHTGTMGGVYRLFSDACRQSKILEVRNLKNQATVCQAFAIAPRPAGERVAVVTHTVGPAILAMDTLIENDCPLAKTSERTRKKIRKIIGENIPVNILPNPIDLTGSGYFSGIYPRCVEAVLEDDGVDIVIAIYAIHRNLETSAKKLADLMHRHNKQLIVSILAAREEIQEDEIILRKSGIPVFQSPEDAALAASYFAKYYRYTSRAI